MERKKVVRHDAAMMFKIEGIVEECDRIWSAEVELVAFLTGSGVVARRGELLRLKCIEVEVEVRWKWK